MGDKAQETIQAARTLSPVGMYGGEYGGDTIGGPAEGTVTGYRLTGQGLAPVKFRLNPRFVDFATDWEKTWSVLARKKWPSPLKRSLDPVVDASGLVVGHFGWVNGRDILIPYGDPSTLVNLLLDAKPVFVKLESQFIGKMSPPFWPLEIETLNGMSFQRVFASEQLFQLVTDLEGRALAVTGTESVGLESADDLFWTLLAIGSLVVALGKFGGRQLIRSLVRARGRATSRQTGRTLVVGRGAKTGRSTVPDVGSPETLANPSAKPDYPTLLQDAPRKFPKLRGQYDDIFIERIGINPKPALPDATGLTPGGVEAARDLLGPGGTLRILESASGKESAAIEKDIRSMLSQDFTITKVERQPDGLLVTAKKK
jgi:hypothetical protein